MSEDVDSLKDAEKEAMNQAEHEEYTHTSSNRTWQGKDGLIPGLILIVIGAVFLFTNVTGFRLHNWWAFFILIPAIPNYKMAWESYQANGRLSGKAGRSLMGGIILTVVAAAFLFNLNWGLIWPLFLIMFGISALVSR